MSASKEKKRRQTQPTGQSSAPKKKSVSAGTVIAVIGVVVLLLLAIFFAFFNTGFLERNITAVTVGNYKVPTAIYNYFYGTISNNMGVASLGTDPATIVTDETTGETLADYLREETNKLIAQTYGVYAKAQADGFVLPESNRVNLDALPDALNTQAASSNLSGASALLTAQFGKGSDLKTYMQYAEISETVAAYTAAYATSLTYTDEEISTYYTENRADLDTVSYYSYLCAVDSAETDAEGNAVVDMDASKALAESIATAGQGDLDVFQGKVAEQSTEETVASATLNSDKVAASVPTDLSAWLFDASRQAGDTAVAANGENGYYVAYFVDNSAKYDTDMANVRHLLIRAASTEEADVAEAHQKAADLLAQYEAGEKTEDAFASLAKANSQDTGSAADGGLIENIYPGAMVEPFNDWVLDPARQPGDTGLVDSTYGTHAIYYVSNAGNYAQYRVVNAMRSDAANAWTEELAAAMTVTTHSFGMKLAK